MEYLQSEQEKFYESFLAELKTYPHRIQGDRSVIKNCISELIYQHEGELQASQESIKKSIVRQQTFADQYIPQFLRRSTNLTREEVSDQEDSSLYFVQQLYSIYKEIKSPVVIVLSQINVLSMENQTIVNLILDGTIFKGINSLIVRIDDAIQQSLEHLAYARRIVSALQSCKQYYEHYIEQLVKLASKGIKDSSLLNHFYESSQVPSKDYFVYQLKSPIFESLVLDPEDASRLMKLEDGLLNRLRLKQLQLSRIGPEIVYAFQRYHLSNLVKRALFDLPSLPGIVIRLKEVKYEQSKPVKRYYYFFVSQTAAEDTFVPFTSLTKTEDYLVMEFEQRKITLNPQEYAKHYLGALLTQQYDYIITNYALNDQGQIISFADHQSAHLKEKPLYEELRNPLLFFKDLILNQKFDGQFLRTVSKDLYSAFLGIVQQLTLSQHTDFSYPLHKPGDKDYYKRKRSLQLNVETTYQLLQQVSVFEDIVDWLKELVLPSQRFFTLAQITSKMSPVLYKFLDLTIVSNHVGDFCTFLRSINLEEILTKSVDKKYLTKYTLLHKELYELAIEKRASEQFRQFFEAQESRHPMLKNQSIFKWFRQSPVSKIMHLFQRIDLQFDITINKRAQTLEFVAVKLLPQILNRLTLFSRVGWRTFIKEFHQSWQSQSIWGQTFTNRWEHAISTQNNFRQESQLYVELMGFLFGIDIFNILGKDTFSSLSSVKHEAPILELYMQCGQLKGDIGYPSNTTLMERALQLKKFDIVLELIEYGEGQKIHTEHFYNLISVSEAQEMGLSRQISNSKQRFQSQELETIQKIFGQLMKLHASLTRHLIWQHIWTQEFTSVVTKDSVFVVGRGELSIPMHFIHQLFTTNDKGTLQMRGLEDHERFPIFGQIHEIPGVEETQLSMLSIRESFSRQEFEYLLFLQEPKYPCNIFMANSLFSLLRCPNYRPFSEILYFCGTQFLVQEQFRNGETLKKFLETHQEQDLMKRLLPHQVSNRILLNILMLPSNVSPSFEVLISHPQGIDDDQSILNIMVNTNPLQDAKRDKLICSNGFACAEDGDIRLESRSILFLLEYMYQPIPAHTLQKFRELDLVQIIIQWVKTLQQLSHQIVDQSNTDDVLHKFNVEAFNGVAIKKQTIISLLRRAYIIQKVLLKPDITHMELLRCVSPSLAIYYQHIQGKKSLTLLQKFDALSQPLRERSERFLVGSRLAFEEAFAERRLERHSQGDVMLQEKYYKGPGQLLKVLEKYLSFLSGDLSPLERIHTDNQLNFFLQNLEINAFNEAKQIALVTELAKYSSSFKDACSSVTLKGANHLHYSNLNSIQLDRINSLNIKGFITLTDLDLTALANRCRNLTYLNISRCVGLTQISSRAEKGFLKQVLAQILSNNSLVFPSLKTLIADNLPSLRDVEIEGVHIQNLSFTNCTALVQIFEVNCPKLQRVKVENCRLLKEDLVMLWLISGKQLLFDENTSGGAFQYLLKPRPRELEQYRMTKSLAFKEFQETKVSQLDQQRLADEEEYGQAILEIFGKTIKKQSVTDMLNLIVVWLFKKGVLSQDINKFLTGLGGKGLNTKAKELIQVALARCLFENPNLHQLNLKEISQQWKHDDEELLSILISSMFQAAIEILSEKKQKTEDLPKLKRFFENVEVVSFSWLKTNSLIQVARLFELVAPFLNQPKKQLYLDFSQNHYLPSDGIHEFLMILQGTNKFQISRLDLSRNQITRLHLDALHPLLDRTVFGTNSVFNIGQLSLKNSGIDDHLMEELAKWLWRAKYLKLLDLSENQFTYRSFNALLEGGLNEPTVLLDLHTLILNWNNLNKVRFELLGVIHDQCNVVPSQTQSKLRNRSKIVDAKVFPLTSLHLQRSFKPQCDINSLCDYLSSATCTISMLDLSQNSFSPQQTEILSSAFVVNTSLRTLSIQQLTIGREALAIICRGIAVSTSLEELNISLEVNVDDEIFTVFCELVKHSVSLRKIQVSSSDVYKLMPLPAQFEEITQAVLLNDILIELRFAELEQIINRLPSVCLACIVKIREKLKFNLQAIGGGKSEINLQKKIDQGQEKNDRQKIIYKLDGFKFGSSVDYQRIGLSIDGGGTRGLIPATMINYISEQIGRQPYEIFDSIGGSSIGGIIALGLAGTINNIEPIADHNQIVKIFTDYSTTIFDRPAFLGNVRNLIDKAKYDPAGIESVLQRYFSVCKLSDVMPGTSVSVTAVRMEKIQGKNMAKIFSSREAIKDDRKNYLMREVGRATSAAPTYFPAAQVTSLSGKRYSLIDGGVGLNNPSKLVMDELCLQSQADGNPDNYFLLSLSTGVIDHYYHQMTQRTTNLKNSAGFLQAGQIIDALGYSAQDFVDSNMQANYKGRLLRVIPQISVPDYKALLDSTDPGVFEIYQSVALDYAQEKLDKQHIFGKFKDRSFLEWVAENTDRKRELM